MRTKTLAIALALVAAPALAGNRQSAPVTISFSPDGSGSFSGALGDARASGDSSQWIGCAFGAGTSNAPWSYCYAVDAAGHNAWCYANNAPQLQVVGLIGPSSKLTVYFDRSGNCSSIQVDNFSYTRPTSP